jgi:hypothetical protein
MKHIAFAEIRFPFLAFQFRACTAMVQPAHRVVAIMAGWQSGYAAACKAVDAGSIPTPASN